MLILSLIYSAILLSLIWARVKFFRIRSDSARVSSRLYDPIVAVHAFTSYYYMYTVLDALSISLIFATISYFISLFMFWWAIVTAKSLDFAFSGNVGKIITNGPFAVVRHPFYLSYTICWLTSTLVFNSFLLWITLIFLVTFYFISARREEKVIMQSTYAKEYASYKNEVGMFLPRVAQWINWLSKRSRLKVK